MDAREGMGNSPGHDNECALSPKPVLRQERDVVHDLHVAAGQRCQRCAQLKVCCHAGLGSSHKRALSQKGYMRRLGHHSGLLRGGHMFLVSSSIITFSCERFGTSLRFVRWRQHCMVHVSGLEQYHYFQSWC